MDELDAASKYFDLYEKETDEENGDQNGP